MSETGTNSSTESAPIQGVADTPSQSTQEIQVNDNTAPVQQAYQWVNAEGVNLDESLVNSFMEAMKPLGFTNEQMKAINEWNNQSMLKATQEQQQKVANYMNESKAALAKEWGDKYDANVKLAEKMFSNLAKEMPGSAQFLVESQLANHPEVVKLFSYLGNIISDDSITGTQGASSQSGGNRPEGILDFTPKK